MLNKCWHVCPETWRFGWKGSVTSCPQCLLMHKSLCINDNPWIACNLHILQLSHQQHYVTEHSSANKDISEIIKLFKLSHFSMALLQILVSCHAIYSLHDQHLKQHPLWNYTLHVTELKHSSWATTPSNTKCFFVIIMFCNFCNRFNYPRKKVIYLK